MLIMINKKNNILTVHNNTYTTQKEMNEKNKRKKKIKIIIIILRNIYRSQIFSHDILRMNNKMESRFAVKGNKPEK